MWQEQVGLWTDFNVQAPSARPDENSYASNFEDRTGVSDNDLLSAIAGQDRRAFGVLMKRYLTRMVVLAQRIVFDQEQAREIAQEGFLRVWQNAKTWDPNGTATFSTWLQRVIVNLAISRRRKFREHVSLNMIDELPSESKDGFDYIADSDKKRVVKEVLEKLSDRQRAAVALFYFESLSQQVAAEVLDMTPRAFDSLIVRARMNLKRQLVDFGFCKMEDLL
jgi:RNA polymerase sigma-70 factor (ECF subfamily)